jgi:hypothetical protein
MTTNNAPYGFVGNKCVLMALSILLVASQGASGGTTIVYKCLDRNLGLVYTDEPCKDGERMAIRAGDADPSAVARLERERDSLDRSAAQRIADERRIAAQRDLATRSTYTLEASNPENYAGYAPYDSGLAWGSPPYPGLLTPRSRYPRGYAPPRFRQDQRFMARRSTVPRG